MSSSMPSKIIRHDILKIYIFFLRHGKRPKATFYVKNTANICQIRKSRNRFVKTRMENGMEDLDGLKTN